MSGDYKKFKVSLTYYQNKKLKSCINKGVPCSLNIENKTTGNTILHFTEDQISKIMYDRKHKKGSQITLSPSQLAKPGRFILLLLAASAPLILRGFATGAASYLGSKAVQKVTEKSALSGSGAFIPQNEYQRSGAAKSGKAVKITKKSKKKHLVI